MPGIHAPGAIMDQRSVFEGHDAREGDHMAETNHFLGLFKGVAEAMEDAAHPSGIVAQDFQRVIPCVALVDDDVQARVRRQGRVAAGRAAPAPLCIPRRKQSRRFVLAWKAMVIEADLADCHDPRMLRQLAQFVANIAAGFDGRGQGECRPPRRCTGSDSRERDCPAAALKRRCRC